MRLIDADKIIFFDCLAKTGNGVCCHTEGIISKDGIEAQPTVDAIPVKWLKTWITTVLDYELFGEYERDYWMKYAEHMIDVFNLGVTEDEMKMAHLRWKTGEKWALRGYEDYEDYE